MKKHTLIRLLSSFLVMMMFLTSAPISQIALAVESEATETENDLTPPKTQEEWNEMLSKAYPGTGEDNLPAEFSMESSPQTYANPTVTLKGADAAIFTDQNIVTVEDETQMTGQFDDVSLQFNTSTHRLGGILKFHDGSKSFMYVLLLDIAQSHLDVTGKRSIIGSREMGEIDGYKLVSFRIEENCESTTLMPARLGLAGKNLVSIGILQKSTNKIFYVQTELSGMDFDTLYNNSWSKDNDYGFRIPNSTSTFAATTNTSEDIAKTKEKEYLFLQQRTGVEASEIDNPTTVTRAPFSLTDDGTALEPDETETANTNTAATDEKLDIRDTLDLLQRENTIDLKSSSYIDRVSDLYLKYPVTGHWLGFWGGFRDSDSQYDKDNPYFYAYHASALAGTDNTITSILFLDLVKQTDHQTRTLTVKVRVNKDICYNSQTQTLSTWENLGGNAIVSNLYIASAISNTSVGTYDNVLVNSKYTSPTNWWDVLSGALLISAFIPVGGTLGTVITAAGMLDAAHQIGSQVLSSGQEKGFSGRINNGGAAIVGAYQNLWKPTSVLTTPSTQTDADFGVLEGHVSNGGTYYFTDYYTIEMSLVVFGKYDY